MLDGDFVISEKNIKQLFAFENLFLFGVQLNQFIDSKKNLLLMEIMHSLDCSNILLNEKTDKYSIQKMEETGLKILLKSGSSYYKKNSVMFPMPVVILNPLSFSDIPLQSSVVKEKLEEKNILEEGKDKPIYFLIKPDPTLEIPKYLMHCKDMLNRFYFQGIR